MQVGLQETKQKMYNNNNNMKKKYCMHAIGRDEGEKKE